MNFNWRKFSLNWFFRALMFSRCCMFCQNIGKSVAWFKFIKLKFNIVKTLIIQKMNLNVFIPQLLSQLKTLSLNTSKSSLKHCSYPHGILKKIVDRTLTTDWYVCVYVFITNHINTSIHQQCLSVGIKWY